MHVQPYLFLDGRCEEALGFYREALGAEVQRMMRWRQSPEPAQPGMLPPGSEDKIMHAQFRVGETEILASDGRCTGQPDLRGFGLALNTPDKATGERMFAALAEGGQVRMPLAPTFFSPAFGMVEDRFGVTWMIIAAHGAEGRP